MTATRRRAAPKPPAPKPDPADAAIGRTVREFFEWVLQLVMWVVSGFLAVTAYRTYPQAGLWGALAIDAVAGLLLILVLLRGSRG